jgi:5-hydroxyisourate hydrolase
VKLSTHVLDTSTGKPARGIAITLLRVEDSERTPVGAATTNADGRTDAPIAAALEAGTYELVFEVAPYFKAQGVDAFYDAITIRFVAGERTEAYHVPLLLAPWGYSTYRGS